MTTPNQELNNTVLVLIAEGFAGSLLELQQHTGTTEDDRVIDNCLKRLKSKEFIAYNKPAKKWEITKEGKVAALKLMTEQFGSPPSALPLDGVVESGGQQKPPAATLDPKEEIMNDKNGTKSDGVADIDAAIAKAKSGKKTTPTEPKAPKAKLTDEEKAEKLRLQTLERNQAKLARDVAREAKKAEKLAARKPAHMSKVSKAASRLPTLSDAAMSIFNESTTNLDAASIEGLSLHLQHFNRTKATELALSQKVSVGDEVQIIGGDPRHIGKTGTVAKAQRIRCYVTIEGVKKDVYLFTSAVKVIKSAPQASAANG